MNHDLDTAVRAAFDEIVTQTPDAGPRPTGPQSPMIQTADTQRRVLMAAVIVLTLGAGLAFFVTQENDSEVVLADGGPTTSLVITPAGGPGIPGLSEMSFSQPSGVSSAAAQRLEDVLLHAGFEVELQEHATRGLPSGAVVQWVYFSDGDRRLFVVEGPTDLIDNSVATLEVGEAGGGFSWPAEAGAITVAFQSVAGAVIVRSESTDGSSSARTLDELSGLGQQLAAAWASDTRGALAIGTTSGFGLEDGQALERRDPSAVDGPQSVVVRRVDGALGIGSAVVTFIPGGSTSAEQITTSPSSDGSVLIGPASGGSVEVRAVGLDDDEIRSIAAATNIVDERPIVSIVSGLEGFAIVAVGSAHPDTIRQARYGCEELDEPVLGALCYAGFTTSPGFEAALYGVDFELGPMIDGHQSVISRIGGGNATLAWEPEPGVIAYIGYSGNNLGDDQTAALERLANQSSFLSPQNWEAAAPQVVVQTNDW